MKHQGLGKGLDALFEITEEEKSSIDHISIDDLSRDPAQPRKTFNQEELDSLAQSIKENGIIQPIIVRKSNSGYTIVAGERRFRAAKQLGLKEVPILVKDISDLQVLEISLVENVQREDLNAIEEATAYRRLSEEYKLTQEGISRSIGKSRVAIANKIRLLNLSSPIQEMIVSGKLSEGHGRALLAIENEEYREKIAKDTVFKGLSVRDIEKIAQRKSKEPKKAIENNYEEEFKRVENDLAKRFGTKVHLSRNINKGKITIEYYSMEGLNRIIDIMKKDRG
ncbi:MAG: ParB/RepB/Spo0J family partition protein [Clostridia bacterium]|nr:ParB/RepB/Spo0J family partition protein [Clostridia bacterium]MBN2883632.1 ParB/RepB/Spo0J family partition protein [Clostridia bacterium]